MRVESSDKTKKKMWVQFWEKCECNFFKLLGGFVEFFFHQKKKKMKRKKKKKHSWKNNPMVSHKINERKGKNILAETSHSPVLKSQTRERKQFSLDSKNFPSGLLYWEVQYKQNKTKQNKELLAHKNGDN